MVPAGSRWISRVPRYSGAALLCLMLRIRGFHPLRPGVPAGSARLIHRVDGGPTTPPRPEPQRYGLFPVRSPLLGETLLFSLPAGTKMFQFAGFAWYLVPWYAEHTGLPHSEIRACAGICPWARLIAACHVLRRLREPRHPSCALFSFPYIFWFATVLPAALFRDCINEFSLICSL